MVLDQMKPAWPDYQASDILLIEAFFLQVRPSLSQPRSLYLTNTTGDGCFDPICPHAFLSKRAKQELLLSWLHILLICF